MVFLCMYNMAVDVSLLKISSALLCIFICCMQLCRGSQEPTRTQAEKQRILNQLLENYDSRIPPSGINNTDGPVVVTVNMFLRSVTSISDYDMEYGVQVTLREEWLDERLKYEGSMKYLIVTDSSRFWTPDLFISNEKDAHLHKLMTPNTFLRIHPSGHIIHSSRLSLTLWCYMELQRFPFDTQTCTMRMASYGYTTDDLIFLWKDHHPIQMTKFVNIMDFSLMKIENDYCAAKTITGEYSCLNLDIFFKRNLRYYVLHTFIPSTILVIVSWASFWLDQGAAVARIVLVLTTLIAMTTLATEIETSIPHVSYIKAMDIWNGTCFTFLLAALLEFVFVHATSPPEGDAPGKASRRLSTDISQAHDKPSQPPQPGLYQRLLASLPKDPHRIDCVARLLFPALFLAFLLLYFIAYLVFDSAN